MSNASQVIFIDDEEDIRTANEQTLNLAGLSVDTFASAEEALPKINKDFNGVIICDIRLPGISGRELLTRVLDADPEQVVILVTGHGDISMAVEAMRDGAYDFIEKPFTAKRLTDTVKHALDKRQLVLENRALRSELKTQDTPGPRLVGKASSIKQLRSMIVQLADTGADILLLGETGTGKEMVARSLHEQSQFSGKPFVSVNCGAITESLIESELFGHEKGAFTGADKQRIGKFEHAQGGTLFLDEIESMSLTAQVHLLRVLQERSFERLGSNKTIKLDIRVIAASKVDLRQAADNSEFREDLYYRLNVVTLEIPPLRQRIEDIPLLFQHFLLIAAARYGKQAPVLPQEKMRLLMSHTWPGNVRELRNAAERYVLIGDLCGVDIDEKPFLQGVCIPLTLPQQIEAFEQAILTQALAETGGSIKDTMERLGVPRKTLYDKMQKHGLDKKHFK